MHHLWLSWLDVQQIMSVTFNLTHIRVACIQTWHFMKTGVSLPHLTGPNLYRQPSVAAGAQGWQPSPSVPPTRKWFGKELKAKPAENTTAQYEYHRGKTSQLLLEVLVTWLKCCGGGQGQALAVATVPWQCLQVSMHSADQSRACGCGWVPLHCGSNGHLLCPPVHRKQMTHF